MPSSSPIVIIGAGGYAKSVVDSLGSSTLRLLGFIDERIDLEEHLGYPVVAHAFEDLAHPERYDYFIAIGNNTKRRLWFNKVKSAGCRLINVVDQHSVVSPLATLGEGCFVGKFAVVNAGSRVGSNVVINTMALVEHGCIVSDHVNLSTRSVINGDVKVGEGTFIGSGAEVIGQIEIGSWSIVGAGAVVTKPVLSDVTVAGVPATQIKAKAVFW